MITNADGADGDQAAVWNGAGGTGWARLQDVLEGMLQPLGNVLVDGIGDDAERVLDVGCGAGGTTLAIARRLGTSGATTGIDISEPLITAARSRAESESVPVEFIRADAQRFEFRPAQFDTIVSRFGVMFFDDFVDAFTNLRSAATEGGALRIITWRSAAENSFMTTAERAAQDLVTIPPTPPDAPGQFALADETRLRAILERSHWKGIDIEPVDAVCTLPEKDLVPYLTELGPLGRAMAGLDASTRSSIIETVRPAFDPYVTRDEVAFTAACWLVTAHA
ncbi:MAG: h16 [Actinomycetia bacterium]|nr:h16 [Actinomycetes bacterium]